MENCAGILFDNELALVIVTRILHGYLISRFFMLLEFSVLKVFCILCF